MWNKLSPWLKTATKKIIYTQKSSLEKGEIPFMKLKFLLITLFIIFVPSTASALAGNNGYDGGISAGKMPTAGNLKGYDYKEVCFLSGTPIEFSGTLTITKTSGSDKDTGEKTITTNYVYNLTSADQISTLKRSVIHYTKITENQNGQQIESTELTGNLSEVVKIGDITYTLQTYNFSKSNIIDIKPAINYFAGNLWGKKVYKYGASPSFGTVTVEVTGDYYGYDEYWGDVETQNLKYIISNEKPTDKNIDKWSGTANVIVSSTTAKEIKYFENKPEIISFKGGYAEFQHNNSILEYTSQLPEFDSNGNATDKIVRKNNSLKLESFPVNKRLTVPNLSHIRGHWSEEQVKQLYSLNIIKEPDTSFNPEEYITRKEFIAMVMETIKEVPTDPNLKVKKITATSKPSTTLPFKDVFVQNEYYSYIEKAYNKKLVNGVSPDYFLPDGYLTISDAIRVLIGTLGLQKIAPIPNPITSFKDNDAIPSYARASVYCAQKIGLIKGDNFGNLRPLERLSKARTCTILNNFINYMREGLRSCYRDGLINY